MTDTQTVQPAHGAAPHHWRFFRAGGFDQVRIETGEDLLHLGQLDQKLWLALSCPTGSVEFDRRTLELIDVDGDGRIRVPELLAAVRWTCGLIRSPDALFAGHGELPLALIDDRHPEGARILASAKRILGNIGKADAVAIGPEDAADVGRIFASTTLNGDGVVPPSAAGADSATAAVMTEIMALAGARPDRGGETGIGQAETDAFFAAVTAHAAWWDEAAAKPEILPLGEATLAAVQAVQGLKPKLDDYFFRCRLAAFDSDAGTALNAGADDFAGFAGKDLSGGAPEVTAFPLARIEAARPLPLGAGLNPAWAAQVALLRDAAVVPLLGNHDSLTEVDWQALQARLAPSMDWLQRKQGGLVESLGIARVREIAASGAQAKIGALIAADAALAPEFEAIAAVETLARYVRDLVPLLNNFVAFRDFYTRRGKAIFQIGTLFIDGRSCDLCIRVDDPGRHAGLATLARIYLLYCECTRRTGDAKAPPQKMTIAAAVTDGDADQLMVGRNGVFYDRHGDDWDAVIVKIVSHPISIREAFWLPFKKVGKFIGEQVEKFAAARSKASEAQMTTQLLQTGSRAISGGPAAQAAPAAAPPPAFDAGKFAGIFAAIGLAIGAIGTALASVVTGFLNLPWWQIPLAVLGVILVVSGPSMVIAAMKLRQRNLGPLLDANGWAVNARALINIPFGGSLTQLAKLPPGSERALTDPYADKQRPWGLYGALIILAGIGLAGWHYGWWARLLAG